MPQLVQRALSLESALRNSGTGQTTSEYSVILAVIAATIVAALLLFSGAVQAAFEVVNDTVSTVLK